MFKVARKLCNQLENLESPARKHLRSSIKEFYAQRNRATVVNISTTQWTDLNEDLKAKKWTLLWEFYAFDKGIHYDLLIFQKPGSTSAQEIIVSGWGPVEEGEIHFCSELLPEIEKMIPNAHYGDAINTMDTTVRLVAGLY